MALALLLAELLQWGSMIHRGPDAVLTGRSGLPDTEIAFCGPVCRG